MRLQSLGDLWRDLRISLRSLARKPGFAVLAVLTIAVGMGATTSIFSLVDAVLLRALPYPKAHELTEVWGPAQSEAVFLAAAELDVFESLAATTTEPLTLTGEGEPRRLGGSRVTPNFFRLLGIAPLAGRDFVATDTEPGSHRVAMVSKSLANSLFGQTGGAPGKTLRLEGRLYEVLGVVPDAVRLPNADTQIWLPLPIEAAASGSHWGNYYLQLIGRLAPGVTIEQARRQLQAKAELLRTQNPIWTPGESWAKNATVEPLQASMAGDLHRILELLMAASLAVLLVACVNVANLLIARSATRQRESAIRSSLGASRRRLLLFLLIESFVIAALGAAIGLAFAQGSLELLTAWLPEADARFGDIGLDRRVLLFTATLSLATAVLFGFLPALRQSSGVLVSRLAAAGTRSGGSASRRLSRGLVVVQLALSLLLLFSAGLLIKSFWRLWNVDTGFSSDSVLLARLDPADADYTDPDQRVELYRRVIERLEQSPFVDSAAAANTFPMGPTYPSAFDAVSIDFDPNALPVALKRDITPGYFETIGLPLLSGRDLSDDDTRHQCLKSQPCAVVVNHVLAKELFEGQALGEIIGASWLGWFEIVGVVANARLEALASQPRMAMYVAHAQRPGAPITSLQVVVKARQDPEILESLVRETVRKIDPDVPVDDVRTLESVIRGSVSDTRFLASLLTVFAIVALLLGGVGVYGVVSCMVEERRHELGVRAAMGAAPGTLRSQVLLQALGLPGLGILLGGAGALAVFRLITTQLFETGGAQPEILIGVPVLLLTAVAISAWFPAQRVARLDPVDTLREA